MTEREVATWPLDRPVALHPRLQGLTMEVILRAVFGLDPGTRLETVRELLTKNLELGAHPASMIPFLQRGRRWEEFVNRRDQSDALLFELIDERRADPDGEERDDVLAMLLAARHEDGSPMSKQEVRDELMTLLVAGHETTASELAWAFERLARTPDVLRRLTDEIDTDDDAYLTATIHETLRRRPVIPNAAPRLAKEPVEIGGFRYPEGVVLIPNAYLIHHDPDIYPDPYAFRPGALPRRVARHVHVDPVRRRPAALPRRELRDARDEDRAAGRAVARRPGAGPGPDRGQPPAGDHAEPAPQRADGAERAGLPRRYASSSRRRSRNAPCAGLSFALASSSPNQPARSTSGTVCIRPEPGGHSSSNVLLTIASASRSPSTAQAVTSLPPFWRTLPRSASSAGDSAVPVSSSNSRSAHACASSSSPYSPFGIDQAPASLRAQNGPPGCTIRTCGSPSTSRYSRMPALRAN